MLEGRRAALCRQENTLTGSDSGAVEMTVAGRNLHTEAGARGFQVAGWGQTAGAKALGRE